MKYVISGILLYITFGLAALVLIPYCTIDSLWNWKLNYKPLDQLGDKLADIYFEKYL